MSNSITEIFKIDKIGKGIAVKAIFTILILLRFSFVFFPDAAYDFTAFNAFTEKLVANPNLAYDLAPEDIPLTGWNCVLIMAIITMGYVYMLAFSLYVGLFIRDIRIKTGKGRAATIGTVIGRLVIMGICIPFVYIPTILFLFYVILLLIIIVPWLIMYPACYLSGDSGLFGSIGEMYSKTRGYYLINVRNICIILTVSFFFRMITSLLSEVAAPAAFIAEAFADTFILLCTARYVGLIYIKMIEMPFGLKRVPIIKDDNDAHPS